MQPQSPKSNQRPLAPKPKKLRKPKNLIEITNVQNNLPASCIVSINCPKGIDYVYYAVLDSTGKQLIYKSEFPCTELPAFSYAELKTEDASLRFVCWPVKKQQIGSPSYFGPLNVNPNRRLGSYSLELDFNENDQADFEQISLVLEKHYGKAALPGRVKVVEDQHDIYLPATNTIKLSPSRRNLVHELVHASRKQYLFAMSKGRYCEKTEMIEEFFAEGVANMVKDELSQMENSPFPKGQVHGSTHGYNYDFRIIDQALVTENLQSTSGGILLLENARYFLASEAYHKIAMEYRMISGKHFGAEFNKRYYRYMSQTEQEPNKELFHKICKAMIKRVEGLSTSKWLDKQLLFDCRYEPGKKLYMDINDYHMHDEWLGICQIYHYETFKNGSDWAQAKRRYSLNGSSVKIEVIDLASGDIVYSSTRLISQYENGFGQIKLYFYHKPQSPGVQHFMSQDQNINLPSEAIPLTSGLYAIGLSTRACKKVYFRILGECMHTKRNAYTFARIYDKGKATLKIQHIDRAGRRTRLPAVSFTGHLCHVDIPFLTDNNCEPGILQITYQQGTNTVNLQRNIGYGGQFGGMQFLLDKP